MKFKRKTNYTVERLVESYSAGSLTRPDEYQRGAAWRLPQKQAFVDSLFRGYPLPPLFLQATKHPGLDGEPTTKWDIIDGQQRILALCGFRNDRFPLLAPNEKKLKMPSVLLLLELEKWAV